MNPSASAIAKALLLVDRMYAEINVAPPFTREPRTVRISVP